MAIIVFADGASSGNPGPGGWGAILLNEQREILEIGGADRQTTNNQMELTAVLSALATIRQRSWEAKEIQIHSDSTYVIRGITRWIHAWKKKGWKTAEGQEVLNRALWEILDEEARRARSRIVWQYVPGHSGIPGNERADEIAVQFSHDSRPCLYSGPLENYSVPILDFRPASPGSKSPSGTPAYYLSLVGQSLQRHRTWKECEERVKGTSGAKYKKISSQNEEDEILRAWGVKSRG